VKRKGNPARLGPLYKTRKIAQGREGVLTKSGSVARLQGKPVPFRGSAVARTMLLSRSKKENSANPSPPEEASSAAVFLVEGIPRAGKERKKKVHGMGTVAHSPLRRG